MQFNVGDRVIQTKEYHELDTQGKEEGTVIITTRPGHITVQFDTNILEKYGAGHTGDGRGKPGYCYNILPAHLKKINNRMMKLKEQLMGTK